MCDVVNSTFPDRSAFGAFGQYVRPRMRGASKCQTQTAFPDAGFGAVVWLFAGQRDNRPRRAGSWRPCRPAQKPRLVGVASIGLLMSNTRSLGSDESRNAAVRQSEQQMNPGGICVSRAALDQVRAFRHGVPRGKLTSVLTSSVSRSFGLLDVGLPVKTTEYVGIRMAVPLQLETK
jgi:hypothetical protein